MLHFRLCAAVGQISTAGAGPDLPYLLIVCENSHGENGPGVLLLSFLHRALVLHLPYGLTLFLIAAGFCFLSPTPCRGQIPPRR